MLALKLTFLILLSVPGIYCQWVVVNPNTVKSVAGSCALMPCSFNYPSNIQVEEGFILIWYKNYYVDQKIVYHSTGQADEAYSNRVDFLGEPVSKNCTLLIRNLQTSDSGTFHFRFEIIKKDKWLAKIGVNLEITDDLLAPEVVVPPQITEGSSVTFQCSTPYFCPDGSVSLEWKDYHSDGSQLSFKVQMDTTAVLFTRNLTTSFSWKDDQKKIHCAVSVGAKKATKEITLNVAHSPKGVEIVLQPSGGNLKLGDSVTLTCHVNSSNPTPTGYTWYKDGQQCSTEKVVVFQSLSKDEHGEYRCEAENSLGRKSSDTSRLIIFSAQIMISPTENINEGEAVSLTCEVPGTKPDEVRYSWFKNNIFIKESPVMSLSFQKVSINDGGHYYCKIENDKGSDTSPSVLLNVQYAPKRVEILLQPSGGNLKLGDSVTLTCHVNSSNPTATGYTWYKDGQQFSKEKIVMFQSLSKDDHGEYQCEAENSLGRKSSDTSRLIIFSARIVISPSENINEGEAVTLSCKVPGTKPDEVRYSWFKNNIFIKESPVMSLSFPKVSTNDGGYYHCKIENDKGSDTSPPILINVQYPPRLPSLVSFLETQRGRLAIIHCTVESNPFSELMVYKDGNLIGNSSSHGTPSERVQVVSTENSLRLKIQDVKLSDEGFYSCIAKNTVGNSSASLQFTVETSRVVITPSPEIEEGKEVILTCLATRGSEEGTTYSWYKNSKILKEDVKGKELVLHRLSKIDAGSYFCIAYSSQGTSTSPPVTLHVLFPPQDLSMNSLVSSQGILQAVIQCTVDSDPPSHMFLYRDKSMVASNTKVLSNLRYEVSHSINSLQLEIQNVVVEDEGQYICLANNSYGQMTGALDFTAETAKIIVSPSGDVREGNGVNLTCFLKTMSDNRNYSYSWYKNNVLYAEGSNSLLKIPQVSSLDSGFYYCKVWSNVSSKSSAVVSLNVAYAPRHLQVMSFQDTAEGRSAFIRCTVDSFPSAEMLIYREDQLVASSRYSDSGNERYHVTSSHNELVVNIKNLKLEDEGKYNCTSTNSIGSTSQSTYFYVQTARVLVSPSTEVQEGSQVTMTCNVLKSLAMEAENVWYKNSKWLKKTGDSSLVFDNVKDSDTGYYHCVVQGTEDSSVSQSIFLHVSYGPRTPVMSSYWETQSGQLGIIQCSVDSDPPSSLALYFRGKMMWSSDSNGSLGRRIRISSSQNMVKMEISEVQLEDEGTYLCTATNSVGKASAMVNFTAQTTRIVISPSSVIQEGQAVNLTCAVTTEAVDAVTYTWYKNGVMYLEGSTNTLQFTSVVSEDRGAFYCSVQSPHGIRSSQTVTLNVHYSPKNVYIKSFLDTEHSKTAIILGGADSNPPSDLSVYKDGQLIASSTDGKSSSERMHAHFLPDMMKLEITNIMSSDEGSYVLIAKNIMGTSQASIIFNVEDVHVLVSPSTELREGYAVTLTCEVLDNPQEIISYTWYKNSRWFQEVTLSSFRLGKVSSSDAGLYSCVAHTSDGSKTSPPVSLSVLYPPRNLSLTSFLELQDRRQGVIMCTVDSNPTSQLYLIKGNESLASHNLLDSTQRLKLYSSHNVLRLEIGDITTDDQVEYTCQAHNSLGTMERSIQFKAQSARLKVVPSEEIHEGDSVTLTCEVPRMENTTYTWYKNNKWFHEGDEKTYVLVNVSSAETGSYHCQANHWKGNRASPLVGINVLYGPKNLVISFFLESQGQKRGILSCTVDSHPPSIIVLHKNNILLGSSAERQADRGQKYWLSTSYNYLRLEIRDITADDCGNYICSANNTLRTTSSSIDVSIAAGELLVYKVVTWLSVSFFISCMIVFLYRKKMTKKDMQKTDQKPIEMENKDMSQTCDVDRSVLPGGDSTTAIDNRNGEHAP